MVIAILGRLDSHNVQCATSHCPLTVGLTRNFGATPTPLSMRDLSTTAGKKVFKRLMKRAKNDEALLNYRNNGSHGEVM